MAKRPKHAPAVPDGYTLVPGYSRLFVIEGEGVVPIYVDGEMHRLLRGEPIEITPEDQKHLIEAGIAFEPAKSEK